MSANSKEEEAKQAMKDAENLIREGDYKNAKPKIQEAINLFPTIRYAQELITLSEILHLCQNYRYLQWRNSWLYTLLQIPTSSPESEVNSRYEKLRADLGTLRRHHRIKGTTAAEKELESAMSWYKRKCAIHANDKKRKASYPLSDEENNTSVDSDSGGDTDVQKDNANVGDAGDRDDDPYAARSTPEFKKLRRHIFATLPQQPHFNPLAKYCNSVRQEMKLGFDMIFVKLTQKLQSSGGDEILSNEQEDTIRGELSNLEEMGYDVMKLRERFDLMVRVKTLAEEDKSYAEKSRNLEGEISAVMVQLVKDQRKLFMLKSEVTAVMVQLEKDQRELSKLKSEKEVVKTKHCNFKSEMASLKAKLSKGNLCNVVKMDAKDN